jgi:hypothetical protein
VRIPGAVSEKESKPIQVLHCCAVDGQEHNKEIYYERTIQTLEQQLLAFQQGLNGPVDEYDDGIRSVSEPYDSHMEEDNDEQAVAEYMRKCRYDRVSGCSGLFCRMGAYSSATAACMQVQLVSRASQPACAAGCQRTQSL